jgi:predicted permease
MNIARNLRRQPFGFWLVASVLGLGVGATASIAAIVNALVLNPIPVPHPEQLVALGGLAYGAGLDDPAAYWAQAEGLESLGLYRTGDTRESEGANGKWTRIAEVSGELFRVFQIAPAAGRMLRREDETENPDVAIVSATFWKARLSGRRDVLLQKVRLGDRRYSIVGVAPSGFDFPLGTQAWIPRARLQSLRPNLVEGASELAVVRQRTGFVGRVKGGATLSQLQSQMEALLAHANDVLSAKTGVRYGELVWVTPLVNSMSVTLRPTLSTLMAGAAILLAVATMNGALFVFGASMRRRTELAVRQVLGASPRQVGSHLIGQAVTVGLAAGVFGWLVTLLLLAVAERSLHGVGVELSVRRAVPLTAFGLSLALGLLSGSLGGIVTALGTRRTDIVVALAGGNVAGSGARDRVIRKVFTVVQVAAAVVLSLGAMLTLGTLLRLEALDLGQDWNGAAVVRYWIPRDRLAGTTLSGFERELVQAAESVRGVSSVAVVSNVAIESRDRAFLEARSGEAFAMAATLQVAGDYFRVMGIPIVEGHALTEGDELAVIVNQTLARVLWKGVNPLGQPLRLGGDQTPLTVVGVAQDTRTIDQGLRGVPELYVPFPNRAPEPPGPPVRAVLVARCGSSCPEVLETLHERLTRRQDLTVYSASLGADSLSRVQQPAKVRAFLWIVYALMSVGIAVIGVGVLVGHFVTERRFEFGVRLALGSTRRQAVWLAAREGVLSAGIGVLVGAVASRWLEIVARRWLFGVEPTSWLVAALACATVLTCSMVASLLPALRISGNEPLELLRRP